MRRSGTTLTPSINSNNLRRRNGDDKPAAPFAVGVLLLEDLIGQVPRQQEQVIGAALLNNLGGKDGQVGARRIQSLLDGRPIDDEVQRLAADAAVIQQGRAFGGGSIARQARIVLFEVREEPAQLTFQLPHPGSELGVELYAVEAGRPFLLKQLANRIRRRARASDVELQRATVDRKTLDVDDGEPVPAEQRLQRDEREVAEVLVVDRVELERLDHRLDVGDLDDRHAVRLQHLGDARDKTVEVAYVGEHVVGVHDIRESAFAMQLVRDLGAKEFCQSVDSALARPLRDVGGRLDPEHRHAGLLVELQQVAVIAGQLDDEAVAPEPAGLDDAPGALLGVTQHRLGERREIEVVAEQLLRRDRLRDLHQRALGTEREVEREASLRLLQLLFGQEGVGEGRLSER